MKRYIVLGGVSIIAASFLITSDALAGVAEKREANQQKRIDQGVASGQLTEREAARLEKEQARIDKEKEQMLSDGKLDPREKAKLKHDQDKASRRIYKEKHDRQHK